MLDCLVSSFVVEAVVGVYLFELVAVEQLIQEYFG